jgi:hypothetical protein
MASSGPPRDLALVTHEAGKSRTEVKDLSRQRYGVLVAKEPQIWNRWRKKTNAQRTQLLRRA